jgi:hypothetical protein
MVRLRIKAMMTAAAAGLLSIARLTAFDLPAPDAAALRAFGENDGGRPLLGSTFRAGGRLAPMERGEAVFSRQVRDSASRFTAPLGNMTAVEHADGILGIYARIGSPRPSPAPLVEADAALADAGVSGWSGTAGFYLAVFDRKERRWVNPSLLLPSEPEAGPPPIRAVMLRGADGRLIDLAAVRTVRRGAYSVLVRLTEASERAGGKAAAVRRIVCTVSGAGAGALDIETFAASDGALTALRGVPVPVSRVYALPPYIEAAEVVLGRGRAALEVASEAAVPRRTVYNLTVE